MNRRYPIEPRSIELCPRCLRQGFLRRVDVPGHPWDKEMVCGRCSDSITREAKEAALAKSREAVAALTPEERAAKVKRDIAELYGDA